MENNRFETFSQRVSGKKGKWITLAIWIVIIGLLNGLLPQANSQEDNAAPNFDEEVPSVEASALAKDQFPSRSGVPALITWYRESGLTNDDLAHIQAISKQITEEPLVHQEGTVPFFQLPPQALKQQVSEDGTTFIQPIFLEESAETEAYKEDLKSFKTLAEKEFGEEPFSADLSSGQLISRVTGPAGISIDAEGLFSNADISLLLSTIALVLIFLLVIYRSPILAVIPLIGVGFAYGAISPILGWMAQEGWITFDAQGLSIMTVLLFGAGTDYCLFLIQRYRSFLKVEQSRVQAMKLAFSSSAGAIAMSGLTVMIALLVLLLAEYGTIQRFAIPFSLAIFIMMIASLTLVPSLLGIFGRGSFFPFIPRTQEMEENRAKKKGKPVPKKKNKPSTWDRLGRMVVHKKWTLAIVTTLILGAMALFAAQAKYTFDTLSTFPEDTPSREGYALIRDHFDRGQLAPLQIIVETDGKDTNLKDQLESLSYIAKVEEPQEGEKNSNLLNYNAEFAINPYSREAVNKIKELRSIAEQSLSNATIDQPEDNVWIAGQTAEQYDTLQITNRDSKVIIPVIIGMIALLLVLYLRSLTAMVYLMATVLLSYFSALGIGWIILHYGFGVAELQGFIPLYSFVFIVALGEDYNIFMISSIWKKSRVMGISKAISEGVSETGSVITSAGLILAGTFAVLITLPIQVLVQFGTVTAIGVLLDTFVVRPFLVPSLTGILGQRAFWPGKINSAKQKSSSERA
ncbi:MMPL family transporter [Halobacillus salinarum]|uniref:MMPL family transporter n=1 Tax=Halobacillus salinarum TaxID=2932257 RepID=A0ABY4EFN3_9BACI|nr:MMPL family transporter [Halobacillus salinarum]UOQ43267.1 MMPL family transporter [Halobacillus salinarum]